MWYALFQGFLSPVHGLHVLTLNALEILKYVKTQTYNYNQYALLYWIDFTTNLTGLKLIHLEYIFGEHELLGPT